MSLTAQKRARVRRRAQQACEYCRLPQRASSLPHQVDHIVASFHPRKQRWQEHCQFQEDGRIVGVTPEGRATVRLLDFNEENRLQLRRVLMRQGWRP